MPFARAKKSIIVETYLTDVSKICSLKVVIFIKDSEIAFDEDDCTEGSGP